MEKYKFPIYFFTNPGVYAPNYVEIKKVLQYFSLDNCLMFIRSNNLTVSNGLIVVEDFQEITDHVQTMMKNKVPAPILRYLEPIYSTPFSIYSIPNILYRYWTANIPIKKQFQIVPSNQFTFKFSDIYLHDDTIDSTIEQVSKFPSVKAWIYPITVMNTPLFTMNCELKSLNFKASLKYTGTLNRNSWDGYLINVDKTSWIILKV